MRNLLNGTDFNMLIQNELIRDVDRKWDSVLFEDFIKKKWSGFKT